MRVNVRQWSLKAHYQISILSLFVRLLLWAKKEFWNKLYHVRKNAISCVLCASVKGTVLLWAEKIPSEYLNNRLLLMSLKTQFTYGSSRFQKAH